jgi:hypothetical protein
MFIYPVQKYPQQPSTETSLSGSRGNLYHVMYVVTSTDFTLLVISLIAKISLPISCYNKIMDSALLRELGPFMVLFVNI